MSETNRRKELVGKLIGCNRLHRTLTENRVRQLGIHRSQHVMLMNIAKMGTPSQKDIAARMEISPAAVAVTMKKLEAAGLVTRTSDNSDSRVNNISLTEQGKEMISRTSLMFDEIDNVSLKNFTEEEMMMLSSLLEKVKENLKNENLRFEAENQKG